MEELLQQFTNRRFGIFIHYGLYSIPGGVWKGKAQGRNAYAEWIKYQALWPDGGPIPDEEYDALADKFTAEEFDPAEWAREIRNAGAGYVVITTKHHDGFAMYDSAVSDYNVVRKTPFGRDLIGEFKRACDREGILFGAYYSHWLDWHEAGGGKPHWPAIPGDPEVVQPSQQAYEEYFSGKCLPQIRELLDNYGIRLFWLDCWAKSPLLTPERLERLMDLIHSRGGILNSRIGVTWNHPDGDNAAVDYLSMLDNTFPAETISRPWETSGTFNESWGYSKLDFKWKSSRELLCNLISNASKNGNYQLNIGPLPSGAIPGASIRRLREVGAWLAVNGEAIYGTASSGLPEPEWGRITRGKDGSLYFHLMTLPLDRRIIVAGIEQKPHSACILESREAIPFSWDGGQLILELPPEASLIDLPVVKVTC